MIALSIAATLIAALWFAYVFGVRPWHLTWGATHLDRVAALPGDALSPFGGGTRFVARLRGAAFPGLGTRMANYLFWEPTHFVMERKMLLTIKRHAEKNS